MKLFVHWNRVRPEYAELHANEIGGSLETGLLDKEERRKLAEHLREVADELYPDPAPEIFPGTMDALNALGIRKP